MEGQEQLGSQLINFGWNAGTAAHLDCIVRLQCSSVCICGDQQDLVQIPVEHAQIADMSAVDIFGGVPVNSSKTCKLTAAGTQDR